jgi:hypothetical protein
MVAVLKQCGDNLTRENVMKQAASIDDLKLPMLLPGITVSTSADDFCPDKADATAKIRRHYLETVRRGDLGVRQLAIYAGRFELRRRRVDKKVFEEELPLRLLRGANGTPMAPRVDQRLQEELVRFEGWVLAKPEWLPGRLLVQLPMARPLTAPVGAGSPTLWLRRRSPPVGAAAGEGGAGIAHSMPPPSPLPVGEVGAGIAHGAVPSMPPPLRPPVGAAAGVGAVAGAGGVVGGGDRQPEGGWP